jgi:hypothetical protein
MSEAKKRRVSVVVEVDVAGAYAAPRAEAVGAAVARQDFPCQCDSQAGIGDGGGSTRCRCDAKAGFGAATDLF